MTGLKGPVVELYLGVSKEVTSLELQPMVGSILLTNHRVAAALKLRERSVI
jgi:hypothetical protein